jgi:hypothetical protein
LILASSSATGILTAVLNDPAANSSGSLTSMSKIDSGLLAMISWNFLRSMVPSTSPAVTFTASLPPPYVFFHAGYPLAKIVTFV